MHRTSIREHDTIRVQRSVKSCVHMFHVCKFLLPVDGDLLGNFDGAVYSYLLGHLINAGRPQHEFPHVNYFLWTKEILSHVFKNISPECHTNTWATSSSLSGAFLTSIILSSGGGPRAADCCGCCSFFGCGFMGGGDDARGIS
jgi:hypothetical protein